MLRSRMARWPLLLPLVGVILFSQNLPTFHIVYNITIPSLMAGGGEHNGDVFVISIWSGVRSLWQRGATILSLMVAAWSGVLPLAKALLLLTESSRMDAVAKSIGRLAFLDVYAVFVIFIVVRISKITGCKRFLGLKVCKDVGMIYAEPMYGLVIFGASLVVLNVLFFLRAKQRRPRLRCSPTFAVLLNLSATGLLVAGVIEPLCLVEVHSKLDLVTLQPQLMSFSLLETASPTLGFTSAANYSHAALNPNSRIPIAGLSSAFVGLVFVTVVVVPVSLLLLNLVYCCALCLHLRVRSRFRDVISALNECNHVLIFCFSVWLVGYQIESLSQEFSLPPELLNSVGLDKKDAARSLATMSLRLETGFVLLCCAGVVVEVIGALEITTAKRLGQELSTAEELEQLKPQRRGPTYL